MTSPNYQQLLMQLGQRLIPYQLHASLRGGDATVLASSTSQKGGLHLSQLSTCTEEFRHRFEYFTKPPQRTNQSRKEGFVNPTQPSCATIPQYKCVPLSQLSDPDRNIPLSQCPTLQDALRTGTTPNAQGASQESSQASSETDWKDIGIVVGSVAVFGIIALAIGTAVAKISDD